MLGKPWKVIIQHICREGNQVADYLAHSAYSMASGIHVFQVPPVSITELLLADVNGARFHRGP